MNPSNLFYSLQERLKNPFFGYFFLSFVLFNWQALFFLLFANVTVTERFQFFDGTTNTVTLLVMPLVLALIAIWLHPWINFGILWVQKGPILKRQIAQIEIEHKVLEKKEALEEARAQLLATKEQQIIAMGKRSEEVQSIQNEDIKKQVEEALLKLRADEGYMNLERPSSLNSHTGKTINKTAAEVYAEMARIAQESGDKGKALHYLNMAEGNIHQNM